MTNVICVHQPDSKAKLYIYNKIYVSMKQNNHDRFENREKSDKDTGLYLIINV